MNEICSKIALWYDANRRDLPWRDTHDAYRIWLSEIILQQTRVAQGLAYYQRFVQSYPTVELLAAAPLDEVLKLWQGLGYYSRARNLHAAAQQVVQSGTVPVVFPSHYADLLRLKGVGRYTAAAIASFATDERVAVVDGNVYRVLSRLFDVATPIDTGQGQRQFQALADALLAEADSPSQHNQAIMEFGALQCTPTSPHCHECPLMVHCLAYTQGTVGQRPVKRGNIKVRERHLLYIIYIYKDTLWVHQRGAGDIWQGLWEFHLLETAACQSPQLLDKRLSATHILQRRHQLTHQTLFADFWAVRLPDGLDPAACADIRQLPPGFRQVTWDQWQSLAVPRLIDEANSRLSDWF